MSNCLLSKVTEVHDVFLFYGKARLWNEYYIIIIIISILFFFCIWRVVYELQVDTFEFRQKHVRPSKLLSTAFTIKGNISETKTRDSPDNIDDWKTSREFMRDEMHGIRHFMNAPFHILRGRGGRYGNGRGYCGWRMRAAGTPRETSSPPRHFDIALFTGDLSWRCVCITDDHISNSNREGCTELSPMMSLL